MTNTGRATARLRLATDHAAALQAGLSRRQDDLLTLEESVRHMATSGSSGLIVLDRAEDLRRTINTHSVEQVAPIRVALTQAGMTIGHLVTNGAMSPDDARALKHIVDIADGETRLAMSELEGVSRALIPTCQCSASDPALDRIAQRSVDEAANRLEHARRSVFRLVEDLPGITEAMLASDIEWPPDVDRTPQPGSTTLRPLGTATEQRRPPPMTAVLDIGIAPDV